MPEKSEMDQRTAHRLPCPYCHRTLADANGLYQHAKFKHPREAVPKAAREAKPARDDEESLADIAIAAEMKRAMGEPLDPLEESLVS